MDGISVVVDSRFAAAPVGSGWRHQLTDRRRSSQAIWRAIALVFVGFCGAYGLGRTWTVIAWLGPQMPAPRTQHATRPTRRAHTVAASRLASPHAPRRRVRARTSSPSTLPALSAFDGIIVAAVAAVRRLATHRIRVPAYRAQSPLAEVCFGLVVMGTLRAAVRGWSTALSTFQLREQLFKEMAVAHSYRNSIWPWLQTGGIAALVSFAIVVGAKALMASMKEWEQREELKDMNQMGADALFLMSTPVDATRLPEEGGPGRDARSSLPMRFIASLGRWSGIGRLAACVGYLLPLLNILDFGEISASLYPYPFGVPPSLPFIDFLQHRMGLQLLYNAYLKSGYYFLLVWFAFIQLFVRNKSAPFYVRFHSSQAILISMLLGLPQQVFFAVLNPWDAGLPVQTFMYHSMMSLFFFILALLKYCVFRALCGQTMQLPLVSEAAVMWAGKD